jgi:hypothetical protein
LRPMIVVVVGAFGHELCGLISQPTLDVAMGQDSDRGAIAYVEGYLRPIFLDIKDPLRVFFDCDIETSVEKPFGRPRC